MRLLAKTIQIFLPSGDPQGIRIAEITTRIVQVIEVPRNQLVAFFEMPECGQVALYFLVGQSIEGEPQIYIGQTGDLKSRLEAHDKNKDFWERVLIVLSRTNNITQTHALFLEWCAIRDCREAGRYLNQNANAGNKPHTPPPLEADCNEIFETASTLLATLGCPLFEPIVSKRLEIESAPQYFCKGSGADGRGQYTNEGFVVFKGSSGRREIVASVVGKPIELMRSKLIETGVLTEEGERLVFTKDHLFGSPSYAAAALMGRTANGMEEWKDATGCTLNDIKQDVKDKHH